MLSDLSGLLPIDILYIIMAIIAVVVFILVFLRRGRIKIGDNVLDFGANVEVEAERIRRRLSEETPEASPAEKQFVLMSEYHAQGLAQSKISFWFSLVFASIGFIVIIISIFMVNRESDFMQQGQAFVSLVAGTIIEAVSALFFVQSNRARQLMTEFFDRLRVDRKMEESLRLADEISDVTLRSRLQVLLAINFSQAESMDNVLKMVLDLENNDNNQGQIS